MSTTMMTEAKVGDHLCSVWGYDETRVSFYKVVGVTPSGKSLRLQLVRNKVVSSWGSQESVVPSDVAASAPVKTVRVKPVYYAMVSKYQCASVWAGEPVTQDGPGWGR